MGRMLVSWSNVCAAVVCGALSASVLSASVLFAAETPDGFTPLYNGKDLTGWTVMDGDASAWAADGEVIKCIKDGGGWLRTEKMYSDFILKIDFKIGPGGNSGVGLRFPSKGDPAHEGMEVQILDDDADQYKNLKEAQYCGGIYLQAAAKRGAARPVGEWNSYEIECRGPFVKVTLNGQVIVDISIDDHTEGKGGYKALADRPEVGFVGMQCHGDEVEFRNVFIRDLNKRTANNVIYYDVKEGTGAVVPKGAKIKVHYTGRLLNGTKFDSSRDRGQPADFPLGNLIKGWQEGIPGMKVGGRRKLIIPYQLGYGERGSPPSIPGKSTLVFDMEVLGVE
jgi:hypothetical protein